MSLITRWRYYIARTSKQ